MLGKPTYVVKSHQIDIELRMDQHCYVSIIRYSFFWRVK